jgi:hypothetical protein
LKRLQWLFLLSLTIALGLSWMIFSPSPRGILGNDIQVKASSFCREYQCQAIAPEPGSGIHFGTSYVPETYQLRSGVRMMILRLASDEDLSRPLPPIRVLEFSWRVGEFTPAQLQQWLPEWQRLALGTAPGAASSFAFSRCESLDSNDWQWQQYRYHGMTYGVLCHHGLRQTDIGVVANRLGEPVQRLLISLDLW